MSNFIQTQVEGNPNCHVCGQPMFSVENDNGGHQYFQCSECETTTRPEPISGEAAAGRFCCGKAMTFKSPCQCTSAECGCAHEPYWHCEKCGKNKPEKVVTVRGGASTGEQPPVGLSPRQEMELYFVTKAARPVSGTEPSSSKVEPCPICRAEECGHTATYKAMARMLQRPAVSGTEPAPIEFPPQSTHLTAEQLREIRQKIANGEGGQWDAAVLLQHIDSIPDEFYRSKWNEEHCGCDERATKVMETLLECGWLGTKEANTLREERIEARKQRDWLIAKCGEIGVQVNVLIGAPIAEAYQLVNSRIGELDALRRELDDAVDWIRVLNEETVLAGFPGGDRNQTLANVRAMKARAAQLESALREADLEYIYMALIAASEAGECVCKKDMEEGPCAACQANHAAAAVETLKRKVAALSAPVAQDVKEKKCD